MKRTFYEMKHFTKKWNELGFTDDDLRSLQNMLLENPKQDRLPGYWICFLTIRSVRHNILSMFSVEMLSR